MDAIAATKTRTAAERIAQQARNSLGKYCSEECAAYCCRKGYLILNQKEFKLVFKGKEAEYQTNHLLKKINPEQTSFYLGNSAHPCPQLENLKCKIHQSKDRPQCCKDFPLFLKNKQIMLSPRCFAVKKDLLYPYIRKLIKLGYQQKEAEPFTELDIFSGQSS